MKLTSFHNGMIIDMDSRRIIAIGPHSDGGGFINWNAGIPIHVKETPEQITELIKNDR